MLCVECLTKSIDNFSGDTETASPIKMRYYEQYYNSATNFYIEDANDLRLFESATLKGYDFKNKLVYLNKDIDCSSFDLQGIPMPISIGEFSGIFNGNNHKISNFATTRGLFRSLTYENLNYDSQADNDGFIPVISNLYLDNVTLQFDGTAQGAYGNMSPLINVLIACDIKIKIVNVGVSHIIVDRVNANSPENSRSSYTITGIVYYTFTSNASIKFNNLYIDSHVYYKSGFNYVTTDPIDYIIGPCEDSSVDAAFIYINECYCYNDTNKNLTWTILASMQNNSWQSLNSVPSDHAIHKASTIGGLTPTDGTTWYKHEKINGGHPIPRPFIIWCEIRFSPAESGGEDIKYISPDSIYIPVLNDVEYGDDWFDHCSQGLIEQCYTTANVNIMGQSVVINVSDNNAIVSCAWELECNNFSGDPLVHYEGDSYYYQYFVTVVTQSQYFTLTIYNNENVKVEINGEEQEDKNPTRTIELGNPIEVSYETYGNRKVIKTVQTGPGSFKTFEILLIKKITYKIKRSGDTLEIVFKPCNAGYYLENLYFDKYTHDIMQTFIVNKTVKGNVDIGMSAELKSYSVTVK